ncbi:MAG: glycosyltransferase [Nanobdellota archaeon]
MLSFHDAIIYTLCFVGLFTSLMYILTIFSQDRKIHRRDPRFKPRVSVIIPIWNEGSSQGERLRKTVDSLLNCNYPQDKLEIIIVNDGSTDNSLELAKDYEKFGVQVLTHPTSKGKTLAINTGMKHATGELVAGLDADSFILPDVFDKLVPCFKDKNVMAAIPSVKIWKPNSILKKIQFQEFFSAVFVRYVQSHLGSIPLAPGAFTLIRRTFIETHGSLNPKTMVEDLEMSFRIQSEGYLIENVIDANVYTSGVKTLKAFINQRIRWFTGFFIQVRRYRHLFSRRYGNLGVFILPVSLTYIFLTIFVFVYTIIMIIYNSIKWIHELSLTGFDLTTMFEFNFELFFLDISNTTMLPLLLLFITFLFMFHLKIISKENQGIAVPFISFIFTYWLLGSLCWVLALYHYITKRPIRWGPNYFRM